MPVYKPKPAKEPDISTLISETEYYRDSFLAPRQFKNAPKPNTDGIINGLITLFAFPPAPKTDSLWFLHPDSRICTQFKSCTVINFWLRDNPDSYREYRDTAPVPATKFVTGDNPDSYRDVVPIKIVPPSLATLPRGRRDTRNAQ
jgi:hypothetical protein